VGTSNYTYEWEPTRCGLLTETELDMGIGFDTVVPVWRVIMTSLRINRGLMVPDHSCTAHHTCVQRDSSRADWAEISSAYQSFSLSLLHSTVISHPSRTPHPPPCQTEPTAPTALLAMQQPCSTLTTRTPTQSPPMRESCFPRGFVPDRDDGKGYRDGGDERTADLQYLLDQQWCACLAPLHHSTSGLRRSSLAPGLPPDRPPFPLRSRAVSWITAYKHTSTDYTSLSIHRRPVRDPANR
jgi:hypothetical protein